MKVLTVGSEVEFNPSQEKRLWKYFKQVNNGNLYDLVLTKKRSKDNYYEENEYIYEYRSPVITATAYERFINYYFFVSRYSNEYYVTGYYHNNSGSFHTHFTTDIDLEEYEFNNMLILSPFMSRNVCCGYMNFRDSVVKTDDLYSEIEYLNEIPFDSKSEWFCMNTEHNTYEVRLNENIPFWYILLPYIEWKDRYTTYHGIFSETQNYEISEKWIEILFSILEQAKINKRTILKNRKPNQIEAYNNLLDFIDYYIMQLKNKEEVGIRTFFNFFYENYDRYRNMYKYYTEKIESIKPTDNYWEF